jgi:hypothetical protein
MGDKLRQPSDGNGRQTASVVTGRAPRRAASSCQPSGGTAHRISSRRRVSGRRASSTLAKIARLFSLVVVNRTEVRSVTLGESSSEGYFRSRAVIGVVIVSLGFSQTSTCSVMWCSPTTRLAAAQLHSRRIACLCPVDRCYFF